MSERDLPEGTASDGPLTPDQGAEAIFDIIKDPVEPDPDDKGQVQKAEDEADDDHSETDEAAEEVETEGEETEADEEDAETADDESADEDEDEDEEPEADVAFAVDDAKVKLDDGTEVTVAELKRNNLFQRDYSRKTEELSQKTKQFEDERGAVNEKAQKVLEKHERTERLTELTEAVAELFMPQEPDPATAEDDPVGYMQAKADYDKRTSAIQRMFAERKEAQAKAFEEQEAEAKELREQEAAKLREVMPELSDQATYQKFWTDTVDIMSSKYGFTADELNAAADHRMYPVFRDLAKLHNAEKQVSTGKVKETLKTRPVLKGKKRMDPKAAQGKAKQQRADRLRKSGDLNDGIAALMDLDL